MGSFAVTEVIVQLGTESQASAASTATITGTIFWFGGHNELGCVEICRMAGGVRAAITMTALALAVPPWMSLTVRVTVLLPIGNSTLATSPLACPNGPVHRKLRARPALAMPPPQREPPSRTPKPLGQSAQLHFA